MASNIAIAPPLKFSQLKNKSKTGDIIFLIQTFASKSTLHGINHFVQAKSVKRRLLWFSIGISVSLGLILNLFYLFERFFESPVLTDYHHEAIAFVFPDITLCLTNPIYFPPNGSVRYNQLLDLFQQYKTFKLTGSAIAKRLETSDYFYMSGLDVYSHITWNTIIHCVYMNRKCNSTHFHVTPLRSNGNCFTFNASNLHPESGRRIPNGVFLSQMTPDLSIILYKSTFIPDYFKNDPFASIFMPHGVIVMIHEEGTFPSITDGYFVDSYTQFDLRIVKKSHLFVNNKCNPILRYYSYFDPFSNTSKTFIGSQSECIVNTVQIKITEYCKCQWQTYPILSSNAELPFCLDGHFEYRYLQMCLAKAFSLIDKDKLRSNCLDDRCEHFTFNTVVSHSSYPAIVERKTHRMWLKTLSEMENQELTNFNTSDLFRKAMCYEKAISENINSIQAAYLKQRIDLLNEDFIENNFIQLRFVPGSLYMDFVEESEEYPLIRLLGDIGGCVGLWVGASLITIFEIFDLITECWRVFTMRKNQSVIYKKFVAYQCHIKS